MIMTKYYYATKHLGHRNKSTVLYFPKEWDVPSNEDATLLIWKGGEAMPETPYRLRVILKKMNNDGAIGIYLSKVYADDVPSDGFISFCLILRESTTDAEDTGE